MPYRILRQIGVQQQLAIGDRIDIFIVLKIPGHIIQPMKLPIGPMRKDLRIRRTTGRGSDIDIRHRRNRRGRRRPLVKTNIIDPIPVQIDQR